jgi:hypothetical protein
MKQFSITASGFEDPDYVYAETEEEAIIKWAREVVEVSVTEIEQN